jgi:hypothetical protein
MAMNLDDFEDLDESDEPNEDFDTSSDSDSDEDDDTDSRSASSQFKPRAASPELADEDSADENDFFFNLKL